MIARERERGERGEGRVADEGERNDDDDDQSDAEGDTREGFWWEERTGILRARRRCKVEEGRGETV